MSRVPITLSKFIHVHGGTQRNLKSWNRSKTSSIQNTQRIIDFKSLEQFQLTKSITLWFNYQGPYTWAFGLDMSGQPRPVCWLLLINSRRNAKHARVIFCELKASGSSSIHQGTLNGNDFWFKSNIKSVWLWRNVISSLNYNNLTIQSVAFFIRISIALFPARQLFAMHSTKVAISRGRLVFIQGNFLGLIL